MTVHVLPLEASLLTFAQQTGKISFALRNLEDSGAPDVPPVTIAQWDAMVAEARRQREQRLKARSKPRAPVRAP